MMIRRCSAFAIGLLLTVTELPWASPPAVGIIGNSRNCLSCHVNNGPWSAGPDLIVDLLDLESQQSARQADGSFQLTTRRGEPVTVIAVIGYSKKSGDQRPYRNGWIFVDSTTIGKQSFSKFAPGWEINLPYGCRIVGDKIGAYPDAAVTTAPITIRPTEVADDADVTLQVLLTRGESVKGRAKEGLIGNYHSRLVHLRVSEEKLDWKKDVMESK